MILINEIKKYYKENPVHKEGDYKWIYFIFNPITNLCKIGRTQNVYQRHKELERQNGVELIILNSFQCEEDEHSVDMERAFHQIYKLKRQKGEWFKLSVYDIYRIDRYCLDFCDYYHTFWSENLLLRFNTRNWNVENIKEELIELKKERKVENNFYNTSRNKIFYEWRKRQHNENTKRQSNNS
jgi:hypothetical protein